MGVLELFFLFESLVLMWIEAVSRFVLLDITSYNTTKTVNVHTDLLVLTKLFC